MPNHSRITVLLLDDGSVENVPGLAAYLSKIPHLRLNHSSQLAGDLSQWDVIITAVEALDPLTVDRLTAWVRSGKGWLNIIGRQVREVPALLGAQPQPAGPLCELRVLFDNRDHPLGVRLPEKIFVSGYHHPLAMRADDAEIILYADWRFQHSPVMTLRRLDDGLVACTTLRDFTQPVLCQLFYRLIRQLSGCSLAERLLGIGILGYAPSVGRYHGQGAARTLGLRLRAVCDLNPARLEQARKDFDGIKTYDSPALLGSDPDVDVVIVATAPNTHAKLAMQMMAAGKHVVCEKPLALTCRETAAMAEAAVSSGVHLSCHQNRRWDVDYLAIKQALAEDLIGDLFYIETFVGGFSHPCGYWHSDTAVSGGTAYDWGGHYIDWIISLLGGRIEAVIGTRHKRLWHDVTNADQERIQIRFSGGREAEFIHSDVAAARKPKWYLLGTRGAIVGRWRDVTEYEIDPLYYYQQHDIPATEMPPDLTVYRRNGPDGIAVLKPAMPVRPMFGYHRNLADHLLTGESLAAPLEDSMRVVAVLEAAARSMANGGRVEVLDV